MKTKSKINRIFKVLTACLIISSSPILPLQQLNQKAAAADSKRLAYKFDGFSNDALNQFSFNGIAEVPAGMNFIRLTPTTTVQSGAVFNKTTLYSKNNYSFSTAFSFKISPSAAGASDGLTFTIQTATSSPDAAGGGLGYYGINPSFAVKYDTFKNLVYNDPSANYIGIAENGSVVNQAGWYTDLNPFNTANGTNYVLSNGTLYYTWIDYDGLTQNVQVRLGTSPDRASSKKILDVNNIDLGTIFDGKPFYAGFTASTGYPNNENHDIHSWYFVNEYAPIATLDPQNDYTQNQPPAVPNDAKDTTVNAPVSGQVNGTDPDGDSLTYEAGNQPSHGTVTVNNDGTWTYTPNAGYIGDDTFTVIVVDGYGGRSETTITVHVNLNPPSLESIKTATIQQKAGGNTDAVHPEVGDTLLYTIRTRNTVGDSLVKSLSISDSLPEGLDYVPGSLKVDGVSATDAEGDDKGHYAAGQVVGQIGDITDTNWHTVQFQTNIKADQGGKDIRNVAAVNGGNVATPDKPEELVKVSPTNQPPIVPSFEQSTWKNTSVTGNVYGADPDGNPLTFAKGTDPQHGTVTVNPDGTWTYVPDSDYVGPDSFTVTVSDGKGGTTISTVTIHMTEPPNRPPTVPNYRETTTKGASVTGSVYGTDPDGDPVTYTKGNNPKYGMVTVKPDGTWTYVPNTDYVGPDIFTVTVSDGKGGTTTSTITIDVTDSGASNQPPTVPDYSGVTTSKDTSVSGSVKGTDPDGDSLTYTKENDPKHGTVTVNPDGTWTYVPNPGYVGPDSFTVTVSDGQGGTATSTVTVNVKEKPNQPPTARGGNVTTSKDTSVSGSVKGTDPDGDPLTYTKGSDPKHGTVTVNPDGTWTYVPNPGYVGPDSFTVTVSDGRGGTITTTVTVNVTEKPNQPPIVRDENVTTPKNTSVTGSVYGTDPDGDSLTYTKGSDPQHGTVTVNPDGSWKYVPNPGYVGPDSFTVTVSDGRGGTITTKVTINVTDSGTDPGSDSDTSSDPGTNPDPVTPDKPSTDDGSATPSTGDGSVTPSTGDGSVTPSTGDGSGTSSTGGGSGTPSTGGGSDTPSTGGGNGTPSTGGGSGTPSTGGGSGTPSTGGGSGTPSTGGGSGTTPTNTGTETTSVQRGNETSTKKPDQEKKLNQLPNTAANFYNLGAAGLAALVAGLILMRRKKKA